MEPNIRGGQEVQFKQVASSDLLRGDIIVFHSPFSLERQFMKRIVALPGERIEIQDGIVLVGGQDILESYEIRRDTDSLEPLVLNAGEYFLLGDNRPRSTDSRSWGPVLVENIVGRVVAADSRTSVEN